MHVCHQVFETLRKLLLISVLTIVRPESLSYVWISFLVCFAALVITLHMQPYEDNSLKKMQTYSLVITSLTIFYGIMLHTASADAEDEFQSVLLVLMNCAIGLIPTVELVISYSLPTMLACLLPVTALLRRIRRVAPHISPAPEPTTAPSAVFGHRAGLCSAECCSAEYCSAGD